MSEQRWGVWRVRDGSWVAFEGPGHHFCRDDRDEADERQSFMASLYPDDHYQVRPYPGPGVISEAALADTALSAEKLLAAAKPGAFKSTVQEGFGDASPIERCEHTLIADTMSDALVCARECGLTIDGIVLRAAGYMRRDRYSDSGLRDKLGEQLRELVTARHDRDEARADLTIERRKVAALQEQVRRLRGVPR
jgi:hypothetical protein